MLKPSLCLAALLCFSPLSMADAPSEEASQAAYTLMEQTDMKGIFDQAMQDSLEQQLAVNPALVPYKDVMEQFFNDYVSFESIKPRLAALYASRFSADELNTLTDFYSTDTGKKAMELMPELMQEGAGIGQTQVMAHQDELQRMLLERKAELSASAQQ
ncbi:DUF2059 domain-containing protein [Larsenimonas rhizosphaerae]|uniref:DUF2059 domain-containing protein n=1 Tax=Larsenimonas rhizosphaerae TaxID=2944682 RepID=A0AA41ZHK9_9GAMM|nr:DUF2059 domain-containing protein [Larsenimonas rhizosphaerae]MCX2524907.1 DUF2059 domain-containing protein [Larsenimonas rhizosphaerae]